MRVYDVASIGNKGFSEKMITAPFSPLGQDTHIASKDATCVVLATTQPVDPARNKSALMQGANEEQLMHPIYRYAFITDAQEGLILTDITTLTDREPRNNFFKRALTWNEGGVLKGARHLAIAGDTFYVVADAGIVVLDMSDPLKPDRIGLVPIAGARAAQVQFRYLFVTASDGLHVVDITHPAKAVEVAGAHIALRDAHKLHVARTYAYIADGADGIAIVDVTNPEKPFLYQMFNAGGKINDARDIVVGTTNASLFAYVADGRNGLKVLQLTSPESQPKFYGFSPDPKPQLIAWYPTKDAALSLSRGLERDRAVDESGNQIAVFGRIGSRPFHLDEMQKLYLKADGSPWTVSNSIDSPPGPKTQVAATASKVGHDGNKAGTPQPN